MSLPINKKKEAYVFIGPPGSGKGSISALCQDKLGWSQVSTGNLCRKHIANQTKIGKEIDFTIKSGKLIPDEIITQMVEEWLTKSTTDVNFIILDGYPRTIAQAKALEKLLSTKLNFLKLKIVRFMLPDQVIMDRLMGRITCKNKNCQKVYSATQKELMPKKTLVCDSCNQPLIKRKDDNPEAVKERLAVYHKHAQCLLDYYLASGETILEIDADKPVKDVFNELMNKVTV